MTAAEWTEFVEDLGSTAAAEFWRAGHTAVDSFGKRAATYESIGTSTVGFDEESAGAVTMDGSIIATRTATLYANETDGYMIAAGDYCRDENGEWWRVAGKIHCRMEDLNHYEIQCEWQAKGPVEAQ